jgi:hypothetical protein
MPTRGNLDWLLRNRITGIAGCYAGTAIGHHHHHATNQGDEIASCRVEDRRGGLGHMATLRFLSPLIKPDMPISGIRLSD